MDAANTANVVYVLNGANINMLEFRPPQHYHASTGTGITTYDDLCDTVTREGAALGLGVRMWQSNSESAMVTKIQAIVRDHVNVNANANANANANVGTANVGTANVGTANVGTANAGTANVGTANVGTACLGVIINAGAYTHTSIAIADALEMLPLATPVVEVHLSNIYAREGFRHRSYISPISRGVIAGLGVYSYVAALHYIANHHANR